MTQDVLHRGLVGRGVGAAVGSLVPQLGSPRSVAHQYPRRGARSRGSSRASSGFGRRSGWSLRTRRSKSSVEVRRIPYFIPDDLPLVSTSDSSAPSGVPRSTSGRSVKKMLDAQLGLQVDWANGDERAEAAGDREVGLLLEEVVVVVEEQVRRGEVVRTLLDERAHLVEQGQAKHALLVFRAPRRGARAGRA